MSRISVCGLGYAGLVTAAGLAELGHTVAGVDEDRQRVELLRAGQTPIFEPGLPDLIASNVDAGRLSFTDRYGEALDGAEFAFIAVSTPTTDGGPPDLSHLRSAVRSITLASSDSFPIIVNKSTSPVGTGESIESIVAELTAIKSIRVVANPEFLREGCAVEDFMHPARVVVGSTDPQAAREVAALYGGLNAPTLITHPHTAEMIKYASNAFLATKISFINEIASICEVVGADVVAVADGLGLDDRIGRAFLDAGLGFGGSCLPKDVKALAHMGSQYGTHPQLWDAVLRINSGQRQRVVERLRDELGTLAQQTICLLGLSFKPNTDDTRDAPSRELIALLSAEGARVQAFDPAAGEALSGEFSDLVRAEDPYQAASLADAIVLVTEWREFADLDLDRLAGAMRGSLFFDTRNFLDPERCEAAGLRYVGVGRPGVGGRVPAR